MRHQSTQHHEAAPTRARGRSGSREATPEDAPPLAVDTDAGVGTTQLSALMSGGNLAMVQLSAVDQGRGGRAVQRAPAKVPTPQPTTYVSREEVAVRSQGPAKPKAPTKASSAMPGVVCAEIPIRVPPQVSRISVGPASIVRELTVGGSLALTHRPQGAGSNAAKTNGTDAQVSNGQASLSANRQGEVKASASVLSGYAKEALGNITVTADIVKALKTGKGLAAVNWGKAVPNGTLTLQGAPGAVSGTLTQQVKVALGGGYEISGTVAVTLKLSVEPEPSAPATSVVATVMDLIARHEGKLIAAGVVGLVLLVGVAAAPALAAATAVPVVLTLAAAS